MTLVIGHRGASADHPENTIEAFTGARDQGADGVELDVRRSADGVLVVHHDPVLADGRIIAETRSADLPPTVATLGAALAASAPMGVNVEIKNSPGEPGYDPTGVIADQILEVIAAHATSPILISSFDLATLDRVRALDSDVATGFLVISATDPYDAVTTCLERDHQAVHPYDLFVDEALVARCRSSAVAVNVWTVDDPARIAQLASWHVDGIITNRPGLARSVVSGR